MAKSNGNGKHGKPRKRFLARREKGKRSGRGAVRKSIIMRRRRNGNA